MQIKFYKEALAGRWFLFSFDEQMANLGAEIGRAAQWKDKNIQYFNGASQRALELSELILQDKRWGERLKEVVRMRKVFCDAIVDKIAQGKLTLEELDRKLLPFAIAARKDLA